MANVRKTLYGYVIVVSVTMATFCILLGSVSSSDHTKRVDLATDTIVNTFYDLCMSNNTKQECQSKSNTMKKVVKDGLQSYGDPTMSMTIVMTIVTTMYCLLNMTNNMNDDINDVNRDLQSKIEKIEKKLAKLNDGRLTDNKARGRRKEKSKAKSKKNVATTTKKNKEKKRHSPERHSQKQTKANDQTVITNLGQLVVDISNEIITKISTKNSKVSNNNATNVTNVTNDTDKDKINDINDIV